MEEGEIHCIMNLEKYAEYTRKSAAIAFAKEDQLDESEDLNEYVTINQVCQMVKDNSIGLDEEGHHLIGDDGHKTLLKQLKTRIYNSGLSKLASKDLIECAWDDKKKTMIFWSDDKSK